jgi:Malectin domain
LKPGIYELRLHFAETYYGPEEASGGGEGSRLMTVSANDKVLLSDFDVLADSGAGRTADVKVFTGVAPAADGLLHLQFSSSPRGAAILSAVEIVPGIAGRMKPVRIVARDVPYYSNDSLWWSADVYFKGGQLGAAREPASKTSDPELYETERWGHFSYAIPVAPGKYTVMLHFIEHRLGLQEQPSETDSTNETRVFDVYCNGKRIVNALNIYNQVGGNHPLVRTITNLEPNAQGKLLLEFVPVSHYATVSAIEVLPE